MVAGVPKYDEKSSRYHPRRVAAKTSHSDGKISDGTGLEEYNLQHRAYGSHGALCADPTQAALFAYETGADMAAGTTAPARRVGFFFGPNTAPKLTAQLPSGMRHAGKSSDLIQRLIVHLVRPNAAPMLSRATST